MGSKIILILLGLSNIALANSGTTLAINDVTVIDATGAAAISEMTVVITGDRITALGKTGQVAVPANAQMIDAAGQHLIPGLWDMHVHTLWADRMDIFLPLFIANGITGVRDMYGDLEVLQKLRKEVSSGTRIAPHVVTSGPIVDGPKPIGGPKQLYTDRRVRYRMSLDLTNRMRQAGVEFLAGTDTPNPYCLPGFSLHDELELLVQAGFTPMEALQAATRNPARFLGRADTLGTVGEGKMADLVLLNANPLDDISNTRKISSVIVGGTLITRAELTKMLAKVEAENRRR